jgi:hypothetical protein
MALQPPSMRHMQLLAVLLAVVIVTMVTLAPGRLRGPSPPGGLARARGDGGFFDDAPAAAAADDEAAPREDENEVDASAVVIPAAAAAATTAASDAGAAALVSASNATPAGGLGGLRSGKRRKRKGKHRKGRKGRGGTGSSGAAAAPAGALAGNVTAAAASTSAAAAAGAAVDADGADEGEDEATAAATAATGSDDSSSSGGGGDDGEPNPVRDAYARLVAAVGALPEDQRRYVVVKPAPAQGGWGAKVLVAVAALKLALGTGRPLLFANDDVVPLVPAGFLPPHRPFLLSEAPWVDMRGAPRLSHVGKRYNDVWRCWRTSRALGPCVPGLMPLPAVAPAAAVAATGAGVPAQPSPPPPPPQALVFETGVSVQKDIDGSADLAGAYAAALGAPAQPLPSRADFDRLAVAALFGAPAPRVAALVAAAKASLRWESYAVRVGVHIRSRPEAKRKGVPPGAIRGGFWTCAARQIAAAQAAAAAAAGGQPLPPNSTLVYIASDRPSARGYAARRLATALAAAGGTAGAGAGAVATGWLAAYDAFTHTGATGVSPGAVDAAAERYASVLADWLLLGDTDVVVGTEGSAFGATAAMRTGAVYVRAALKAERCARVLRGGAAPGAGSATSGGGGGDGDGAAGAG